MCSRSESHSAALGNALPGPSPRVQPPDTGPPGEHPEISISTMQVSKTFAWLEKKRSVERWTHLPLNLHELSAHRRRHHGAAVMGDGEEPQLLQVHLRVKGQPTEEMTTKSPV